MQGLSLSNRPLFTRKIKRLLTELPSSKVYRFPFQNANFVVSVLTSVELHRNRSWQMTFGINKISPSCRSMLSFGNPCLFFYIVTPWSLVACATKPGSDQRARVRSLTRAGASRSLYDIFCRDAEHTKSIKWSLLSERASLLSLIKFAHTVFPIG